LKQRIKLGKFKFIITDQDNAPKFDEIYDQCPTLSGRLVINGARNNWISYENEIAGRSTLSRHEVKATFKIKTKSTDPALIFFTSGTSKMPKAVMHTHSYPVGHRITAELWHNLKPDDVHLTLSDTGWAKSAWGSYYGQWLAGGCVFVYDIRGKFHPEEILPLLEKYEITSFCAPPTVYRMLVLNDLSKFDFRELRHCYAAGEPLHAETVKLWQEGTGLTIHEGYGQTETVCVIAQFPGIPIRPGSMGIASPGWNVELHDDTGTPVKQGEEGRIAVKIAPERPIGLLAKYLYNEEANSQAFINDYYYTGDKAWQDEDGYFWFVGRSDDIIKSSGYRIGPSEVEDALMKHPSVQEVGVVGAPDTMRGAKVKAYVVLNKGFEPTETLVKELQNHTKELTAPYKYPREIEFMNKLPKTFSGKIKRDLLRKHAETGENGWETA
jgi:acetyl-CoA synthetase